MAKAHITQPENVAPLYGIAVITLKLGRYKESLDFTIQATCMEVKDTIMEINLLYLAALINKRLKKYEDATYAYSELNKIITRYENKILRNYTWGMLLIPILKDRRKIVTMIENLQSVINYIAITDPIDMISSMYNYETGKWVSQEAAKQKLHKCEFFSRYSYEMFCSKIFPLLKLSKYK